VFGFAVIHPAGAVLFDTGIGPPHALIDRLYRPFRTPLDAGLANIGLSPADVIAIINCHLHFDHCGGNQLFPGTPIFAQKAEYEAARAPGYTLPEWVDFPGARFELVDGDAEVLPGISVIPTPGHTPGHQSAIVDTADGRAVLAGQAAETARQFTRLEGAGAEYVASLRRLHRLSPRRVMFSHDPTVWEPAGR